MSFMFRTRALMRLNVTFSYISKKIITSQRKGKFAGYCGKYLFSSNQRWLMGFVKIFWNGKVN